MKIDQCKEYKKLSPSIRKAVDMCIKKLEEHYKYYQEQNITITNIFGDSNIIHDIVDDGFYVYKAQFNKIQVRLLYTVNENDEIDVMYFFIKNNNNIANIKGKRQQRYLALFENFVKDNQQVVV